MQTLSITRRSGIAAGLTALSIGLMILSAVWFIPRDVYMLSPPLEATLAALLGGGVLLLALLISPHKVESPQAAQHAMIGGRTRWVFLLLGLLLLAIGTEASAGFLKNEALLILSPHLQFLVLFVGAILFTLGIGGVSRSSFRGFHLDRADLFCILVLLVLGLGVRAYQLDTLIRVSVDEGHNMNGTSAFYNPAWTPRLLTTINGNIPATMIYSYWGSLSSLIWGRNLYGLRMATVVMGTLSVVAAYGAGRALFNRRIGMIAGLILATLPLHVFYSRISTGNLGDALFSTVMVYFAARAFRDNRRSDWVLLGVSLGMSQYFFEGGRLLFPVAFVAWVVLQLLVLRSRIRPLLKGILLAVICNIVIITPMYFSMWATQAPFSARFNNSGIDVSIVGKILRREVSAEELTAFLDHAARPFLAYVTAIHRDMAEIYGGIEPVVLRVFVPLFLLGVFHALWRLRSATTMVFLIWFGTAFGGIFIASPLVFARYSITTPVVALLMAFGLGCTLPMLVPFVRRVTAEASHVVHIPRRRIMAATSVALVFGGIVSVVQGYYFFNHLAPEFNYSARASTPVGDITDATLRFAERPNVLNEHMYVFDPGYGVPNGANDYLDFAIGPRQYLVEVLVPTDITLETLDSLPRDRTYVFFVLPSDQRMMSLLNESFTVDKPVYSLYSNPVERSLYVMLTAPLEQNTMPRHLQAAAESEVS